MTPNFRVRVGILLLVGVMISPKFADAECLDTKKMVQEWNKTNSDYKSKWLTAVQNKCAEDNKETDKEVNKKCAEDKMSAADKKCNDKDAEDKSKIVQCLKGELGVEVERPRWSFEEFEEIMLSYVTDSEKRDSIKSVLQMCKDNAIDVKRWMCSMKKLGEGPCPELKTYMEEMEKEWSQGHYESSAYDL